MNDHLCPMFVLTRAELLRMHEDKLSSIAATRAELEVALSEARLDRERQAMSDARELLADVEASTAFLRDHVDPTVESWKLTAAQLLETRRSLEPVKINFERLRLALEPGKELAHATYNFNGRPVRW